MKKKKLNLHDLKVKSFITDIDHANRLTIHGGQIVSAETNCWACPTKHEDGCTETAYPNCDPSSDWNTKAPCGWDTTEP